MRFNVSIGRVAMGSVVLAAVVVGSGCGWWRDSNKLYADDAAKRPLEVPPELDRGVATPSGASVTASGTVGTQPMPAGSAVAARARHPVARRASTPQRSSGNKGLTRTPGR